MCTGFSSILVEEELTGLFVVEELVEELTGFSSLVVVEELVGFSTGAEEFSVVDELSSTIVKTLEETLSDEFSAAEEVVSDDISAEVAELVLSFAVLFEQPTSKNATSTIAIIFFIVITSKCLIYFIISHFSLLVNNFLSCRSFFTAAFVSRF